MAFGDYGLKSLGRGWLSANQVEAARKAISHYTKRSGKVWIRIFPDKPVTAKSPGAQMGKGKGEVDHYVAVITPGRILLEIAGVSREAASESLRLAGTKIPFKTKFVSKE